MKREWMYLVICLLISSNIVSGISQLAPWCKVDVNTKIGIFPVTLKADFYEGRFTYTGSSSIRNITVEGGSDFLSGTGNFDENAARIQGSSNNNSYTLTYYNFNSTAEAKIGVKTHASRASWWITGIKQKCEITIELNSTTNVSKITIDKVYFKLFRGDESATLWEYFPGDELTMVGQNKTYTQDMVIDENYDNVSIAGMANITMTDSFGQKNNPPPLSSFSQDSSTIQIKTISPLVAVKIALIPFALPLTIIGMVLCAVAVYLLYLQTLQRAKSVRSTALPKAMLYERMKSHEGFHSSYKIPLMKFVDKNKRYALHLALGAAIISCLGVVFYILGITTIVELVGFAEYITWSTGLFVYVVSTCLLFITVGIIWIKRDKLYLVEKTYTKQREIEQNKMKVKKTN